MARAILVCGGETGPNLGPVPALRPLLDRPMIEHVMDALVRVGVGRIDVILGSGADAIAASIADGRRWGVPIRHHLALDPARPFASFAAIERVSPAESILLGLADRLVKLGGSCLGPTGRNVLYFRSRSGSQPDWTGWARVRAEDIASVAADLDEQALARRWAEQGAETVEAEVLDVRSGSSWIDAQERSLNGEFACVAGSGREVEPGVWLARNVELHPSAELIAPVVIGEDCRIRRGARIGPFATIGSGSVVDAGSRISHSIVHAGTYVGRGLELVRAIVDRGRVHFAESGVELGATDAGVLAAVVGGTSAEWARATCGRVLAMAALPMLAPLSLAALLAAKSVMPDHRVIRIRRRTNGSASVGSEGRFEYSLWDLRGRADEPRPGLEDLLLRVVPNLHSVAVGRVRLVGRSLRNGDESRDDAGAGAGRGRQIPPGLISEPLVRLGPEADHAERRIADEYFVATGGLLRDFRLMGGYLRRCAVRWR